MQIQSAQRSAVTTVKLDQIRRRHSQPALNAAASVSDGLRIAAQQRSHPRAVGLNLLSRFAQPAQSLRQFLGFQRQPAARPELQRIDVYV